ncbi:MAG: polysaccharide deacetylase family protein [Candidatus Jettenia caeni]|nr:polysaccharide deacetylase family protein [Candidatus Jettenia caeni]
MANTDEPLYVAISLDIDPDANTAVKGQYDALSSPVHCGKISTDACKKGLQKIFELLDVYTIESTLFYEARTAQILGAEGINLPKLSERHEVACHSLKHEDFLGKISGMPMEEGIVEEIIKEAKGILEKIFARNIRGFRAPYTRVNHTVIKALEHAGFQYDSSETVSLGATWAGKPFSLNTFGSNLLELALPSFLDRKGKKMSSYLWTIFEDKRSSHEYIDAVLWARELAKGGLFLFAIHPWHLYVNSQGSPFRKEQVNKNLKNFEYILSQIKQMQGVQVIRQDTYLENWLKLNKSVKETKQ